MEKTRWNIELGNDRFTKATEWRDEIRIDVREWGIQNDKGIPTKKGIRLSLHRWKMLVDMFEFLDQALDEKRDYATHLGRNVYATVKASGICVDILCVFTNQKTTNRRNRGKWFKNCLDELGLLKVSWSFLSCFLKSMLSNYDIKSMALWCFWIVLFWHLCFQKEIILLRIKSL
jgi:hypothetical protein